MSGFWLHHIWIRFIKPVNSAHIEENPRLVSSDLGSMRSSTPTECAFIVHCWIPPFFAFCHQNYKLPKKSKNFIKKDWQIKSAVLLYRQPTERVVNFERRIASWRHRLTQPIPPECACVCALIVMPFFDAFSIHELNAFKMLLTGNLERVSGLFLGGIFMLKQFTVLLRANYRFGRMCRCWHNRKKLIK